jgi:hypothetical protein
MLLFFVSCSSVQKNHHPEIKIDNLEYDFGVVSPNDTLRHTFNIKSTGTDTLEIFKVSGSCNCLHPKLNKKKLGPFDSTSLIVKIVPKKNLSGAFSEKIVIEANTKKIFTILTLKGIYSPK